MTEDVGPDGHDRDHEHMAKQPGFGGRARQSDCLPAQHAFNRPMNRDAECRAYFEKVGLALAVCQQVEEELKRYITMSLELASKLIGNEMTFRLSLIHI